MLTFTHSRRNILRFGAAAAGASLLPAPHRAGAQDVTVTFWNTLLLPQDPNDKTKPLEDFYIYQAIARFEASHPGVKIAIENVPSDADMFTKYRTASVARNGPDVMGMWSGSYMLGVKDFLEPLASYFTPEERARITGWEAVAADFQADSDQIFGVPAGSDGTTCVFYNTELLTAAGVDPESAWPTEFDAFVTMLDQVKAGGTTPFALEANGIIWQILSYWMAQSVGGSPGIGALNSGERNFNDPALIAVVEKWRKLYDYTIPGAETMKDAESDQLFFAGEGAMTTSGFWSISDYRGALGDNLGMVKIPNVSPDASPKDGGIGGAGTANVVSNYSEHKAEAVDFIKFLMSADEQAKKAESGEGSLLNVTDVDVTPYYTDPLKQTQQQWANEPSTIFWIDNVFPADLTNDLKAQAQLAWTGQLSAEEFLAKLDAKRAELLGS